MSIRFVFLLLLILNTFAISLAIILKSYTGINSFKEGGFITFLSAFQLLTTSGITYKIFQIRKKKKGHSTWRHPSAIWMIITLGFLFLAADEIFEIHERTDRLIHFIFNLHETGLTDRLDDIIVGIYGLIGIGVLVAYRKEVKTCVKNSSPFIWAFVLLFSMVVVDIITNRLDALLMFFEYDLAVVFYNWLSTAEESLKLFAEVFFVLGFYAALQKAMHSRANLAISKEG